MRLDTHDSTLDFVLEALDLIWSPGIEAMNVQKNLNVRSLEDTVAAAERAGYDVHCVDLPDNVSGFATVIDGTPFIAVNRAKPRSHVAYTVSHELGHQILHLNPSRRPNSMGIPLSEDLQEFQAHMFAASWVLWAANEQEKKDVLQQNPESCVLTLSLFLSLGVVVTALGFQLWSRLSKRQLSPSVPQR